MVEKGSPAPAFTLRSDAGEDVSLESLRGRPVVLYFYPRDDTPGCTAQACGIRDAWAEFERAGAVVLGVSPDDEASHAKFKEKYDLPFSLLADSDHATADDYGVWVEKTYAGKTYMGVERSTFVIDADGNVAEVMRNVKPDTHADQVLAALPSLDWLVDHGDPGGRGELPGDLDHLVPRHPNAAETFDSLHVDELAVAQLCALARRVDEARAGQVGALEADGPERRAEEVHLLESAVPKDDPLERREAERGEVEPRIGEDDVLERGLGQIDARRAKLPQSRRE